MSDKQFLLRSSAGINHFWVTQDDGSYGISSEQDVEAIVEDNKARQNHNDGFSPTRELRHIAHVPTIIWLKWLQEEGFDAFDPANDALLRRKLNDPEWRYLRTCPGRV
jgi:hypothetical protein